MTSKSNVFPVEEENDVDDAISDSDQIAAKAVSSIASQHLSQLSHHQHPQSQLSYLQGNSQRTKTMLMLMLLRNIFFQQQIIPPSFYSFLQAPRLYSWHDSILLSTSWQPHAGYWGEMPPQWSQRCWWRWMTWLLHCGRLHLARQPSCSLGHAMGFL